MDLVKYYWKKVGVSSILKSEWCALISACVAIALFVAGVLMPDFQGYYLIAPAWALVGFMVVTSARSK